MASLNQAIKYCMQHFHSCNIVLSTISNKLYQKAPILFSQQYLNRMQLSLQLQAQKLNIIIVSDIHLNLDMLPRLSKSIQANGQHFDYCLVGGDIANCDHENKCHSEREMIELTKECLTRLHDILQCKVLWIPGNHDPVSFLNGQQHGDQQIINIHKKQYVLEIGLTISGLGGSLPAYTDMKSESQQWCGYPYKNQEEYNKDLELVFREDQIKSSKIFFTHVGPSASNTTVDRRKQYPIYAGSHSLNKYIQRKDMLLLIHGHVHNGGRYDIHKDKPIINPGALLFGDYAILKLARCQKIWNISKISFQKII